MSVKKPEDGISSSDMRWSAYGKGVPSSSHLRRDGKGKVTGARHTVTLVAFLPVQAQHIGALILEAVFRDGASFVLRKGDAIPFSLFWESAQAFGNEWGNGRLGATFLPWASG